MYTHFYIHIHIHICFVYIFIYVNLYSYCMYTFIYIHIRIHILSLYLYTCIFIYMYFLIYIYSFIHHTITNIARKRMRTHPLDYAAISDDLAHISKDTKLHYLYHILTEYITTHLLHSDAFMLKDIWVTVLHTTLLSTSHHITKYLLHDDSLVGHLYWDLHVFVYDRLYMILNRDHFFKGHLDFNDALYRHGHLSF